MKVYVSDYNLISSIGLGGAEHLSALESGRVARPGAEGRAVYCVGPEFLGKTEDVCDRTHSLLRRVVGGLKASARGSINTGVIIGSARGATGFLEKSIARHGSGRRLAPRVSPLSTAGGLSALVSEELRSNGPHFSLSSACVSSLHALMQGAAMVEGGVVDSAVVGGAEASTTEFCLAMFRSLRLLAADLDQEYPCKAFGREREGLVLGEGAALLRLSKEESELCIEGFGAASEHTTATGLSESGDSLVSAIERCLQSADKIPSDIDLIVPHGAGTRKGDAAEHRALARVFGEDTIPALAIHKWAFGHCLGAAGAMSLVLACEHLRTTRLHQVPYETIVRQKTVANPKSALVCGLGFGGGAVAVLVTRQ